MKGLNLAIEGESDEDLVLPPTREQHQKKFGDKILGDFDDDNADKAVNEEEAPKPTADVLMSRNLRGGNRGFNFAFGDGDSSSDEETKDSSQQLALDFKKK